MSIDERNCGVGEERRLHYLTLVVALPPLLLRASVLSVCHFVLAYRASGTHLYKVCFHPLESHSCPDIILFPRHSLLCHLSVYSFYCLGTCHVLRFPVLSYLDSPGTPIAVLGFCPVLMGRYQGFCVFPISCASLPFTSQPLFFFFLLQMNKHVYMGRVRDVGRGKGEGDGDVR